MEDSRPGAKLWQSSAWSFVKSLTSKSEEVLQAYQRDLQEFGIGLKKETAVAAEVTAHAVKELPISLETTAAVAQESLEAVGQTLEELGSSVWKGTADLIGQVKEAVKKVEDATEGQDNSPTPVTTGRYRRYEAQLNAMQCDSSTYCDEPEDQDDYSNWKSTFDLDARKEEIDSIMEDNAFIQELYSRIVPNNIDHQTFWMRYFYRLNKLQQAEDARADLVKRANAVEEDLSWEVDEDNDTHVKSPAVTDELPATSPKPASDHEGVAEDEVGSDNSNSSEWLVVQEDNPDVVHSSPGSQQTDVKEESDEKQKAGKRKDTEVGATDEDWGEWE